MVNQQLINPESIVVVGGTDNIKSPGGKVLKNLIDSGFAGELYVVNPKQEQVQGLKAYKDVTMLPSADLAIFAIPARFIPETARILAQQKNTRAFIVLSAGFSEESAEGKMLEDELVSVVNSVNGALIGPNCIGVLNTNYAGVFTTPIPALSTSGVDFISGSGATAVFIMEAGVPKGLSFSSVYSVGNSAQMGVEEILEYLDNSFDPETSSKVKLLYVESISKPEKLVKHATSLIKKGCRIAAIKSGSSEAGSRAASSHTGAMASPDLAVDALFRKAGIVRCHGREELISVASLFMHKPLTGKNIAVITHAGGPAVMLTDALSKGGLNVPPINNERKAELLEKLFPGSSVNNPIDFLATGTAEQLGHIIDYCENVFDEIDAMAVIFGSPGLFDVYDVYDLLHEKMKQCSKPIYPILPSVVNVKNEIKAFLDKGRINFPDEVIFGNALASVHQTPSPFVAEELSIKADVEKIRNVIEQNTDGYLLPEQVQQLLDAVQIDRAQEQTAKSTEEALAAAAILGFPLVMKVVGPVHKSDVGGVVLHVKNTETVEREFKRMIQIPETTAVLLQQQLSGIELYIGANRDDVFGHMILAGLGGIFVEVLKDVQPGLLPVGKEEARYMISKLRGVHMLEGVRGQEPVDIDKYTDAIVRLSELLKHAPEIAEMDINPLLGSSKRVVAVDARIRLDRTIHKH